MKFDVWKDIVSQRFYFKSRPDLVTLGGDKYIALHAKVFLVISTTYSTAFLIQGSFLKNWGKT